MIRRLLRREKKGETPHPAKLVSEVPDAELGRFQHHPTYSMWGAMKYILVLSLLLWWLPSFGQMIAGYIGGRRSGGPWRGALAAIVPVLVIVILAWSAERGLLGPWLASLTAIPGGIGGFLGETVPPAAPYVTFVLKYLGAFVSALQGTLAMGSNGYLVTIVFAYIGGILAEQSRREAGTGRGTSVGISISQPFFGGLRNPASAWEAPHRPVPFDGLSRIPVANAQLTPHARPKVDARRADGGAEEGFGVRNAHPGKDATAKGGPKPEHQAPDSHEKDISREIATRKWVERALRQYETAHRR